ncbi:MAG: 16S rRNA (cytidine(1402)-2'-O)-methyltransferase [Legionellaceae bacterium]|nr:16S rRNA (cytidine(1402)-2'-O)-methyltransferase [Legionellaceae bacterium]
MTHSIARSNGTLYVVATPIGNRDDITQRAIHILKTVDLIAAEDTRHSKPFLEGLGIQTKLIAFHAHNESNATARLIDALKKGQNIALISDAGTPLIRDPGYPLVTEARRAGIGVVPIPGACALITALSAGGVPSDVFTFGGFLPATKAARLRALEVFKSNLSHTLVFYESTHRLLACLEDIKLTFGDKVELVLAKELTKTFEAFVEGCVDEIKAWLLEDVARQKGEFVLMILPRELQEDTTEDKRCLDILLTALPVKQAVKIAAELTGSSRNALYALAIADKK